MPECIICNSIDFELLSTRIREGDGRIIKCRNCNLVIQEHDANSEQLKKYYDEDYQRSNSLETGIMLSAAQHYRMRMKTIEPLFKQISGFLNKNKNILEIGCGAGTLLSKIKPLVKKCTGIEINSSFVKFITNELKIDAFCEDLLKVEFADKFDLIITIDTLDHLINPVETLGKIRSLLKPDGILYIEVPNRDEALNYYLPAQNKNAYQNFFWHRAHNFYFTMETLNLLLTKVGFKSEILCRHNYTMKNFFNWYFTGKPQSNFVTGLNDSDFFTGKSEFEKKMNTVMHDTESKFKTIASETFAGDTLCAICKLTNMGY